MTIRFLPFFFALLIMTSCKNSSESDVTEEVDKVQQWLTYEGKADMPKIVFVTGGEEYRSEEGLPQLAKILSTHHGFNATVLFAQDPAFPGKVDPNYVKNIPGLESLDDADLMVILTRFRALPDDQMKHIDDYLKAGKPVVAMRTATHAFKFKDIDIESSYTHYGNYNNSEDEWQDGFGRLVMGENWRYHHGNHGNQSTRGIFAEGAAGHPILNGIEDGAIWGPTDVYGARLPLPGDSQVLVLGQNVDRTSPRDDDDPRLGMRPTDLKLPVKIERKDKDGNPVMIDQNDPMMPVAWTKSYQLPEGVKGKCFASTMGAATDLLEEATRRMFVNGVFWALGMEVPAKADVTLVGDYNPSKFAFHKDEYWDELNLIIGENVK